jgi:hypothetical protein
MRIFLFLLLLPLSAHAGAVVLMVNMNYSSAELKAAEDQAAARGQRLEMVPPKSMIGIAEPMFAKREQLQTQLERQFPNENPLVLKSAVAGIMREGSNWNENADIASFVGAARMDSLSTMAIRVANAEKQNGEMYDQLRRKAIELRAKGDRVDSMILSSHSDGSNLTGETALRLSSNDLGRLKQEQPDLFDNARHVLLLGCYNMTKPNHQAWRYDLFPNASMLAGFGVKAPSRYDNTSPSFIRQTMIRAQQLDEHMAATGRPIDPDTLEKAFKTLSTFTTTAHPGVVDYCYSVVEGQSGTWTHNCDSQWKELYEKKNQMRDYWSLVHPVEDPPSESGGELRAFYNTLQGACPAWEAKSEKDDWQASERLRVSMRENVIRLIFWWNVQHNFGTYYLREIGAMDARLTTGGLPRMPRLDGTLSRVDFVNAYNSTDSALRRRDPAGARQFEALYGPLFFLKGEDTVAEGEKLTVEGTLARGAIPFNWIEGTTVMGRRP